MNSPTVFSEPFAKRIADVTRRVEGIPGWDLSPDPDPPYTPPGGTSLTKAVIKCETPSTTNFGTSYTDVWSAASNFSELEEQDWCDISSGSYIELNQGKYSIVTAILSYMDPGDSNDTTVDGNTFYEWPMVRTYWRYEYTRGHKSNSDVMEQAQPAYGSFYSSSAQLARNTIPLIDFVEYSGSASQKLRVTLKAYYSGANANADGYFARSITQITRLGPLDSAASSSGFDSGYSSGFGS